MPSKNSRKKTLNPFFLILIMFAFLLPLTAGCGSGGDPVIEVTDDEDTNEDVVEETLGMSIVMEYTDGDPIPANGSAEIHVILAQPYDVLETITVTTRCVENNLATLNGVSSTGGTEISAIDGEAIITYEPNGCVGIDQVAATSETRDGAAVRIEVAAEETAETYDETFSVSIYVLGGQPMAYDGAAYITARVNNPSLYTGNVTFTSGCVQSGASSFEGQSATKETVVAPTDGIATVTYIPAGCSGTDTIAVIDDEGNHQTTTITIEAAPSDDTDDTNDDTVITGDIFELSKYVFGGEPMASDGAAFITATILYPDAYEGDITFTSACVQSNLANFEGQTAAKSTTVTPVNGIATVTYMPDGCEGSDNIAGIDDYGGVQTVSIIIQAGLVDTNDDANDEEEVKSINLTSGLPAGSELSPVGSTEITVNLAGFDSGLQEITFTSNCAENGLAVFEVPGVSEAAELTVNTYSETATVTYTPRGCYDQDVIVATAGDIYSVLTIPFLTGATTAINYVSSSDDANDDADSALNIALKDQSNTDRQDWATIQFKVIDEFGNPVRDTTVDFELTTEAGGITLQADSAVTDSEGIAEVILYAGTTPTHVRVRATVAGTDISALSDKIIISTGFPDQDSFSLSATPFNPEAWNYNGAVVSFTVHAADHFNNPVPDGFAIYFTTEGGSIDPSCATVNGSCSVTWRSQEPRPDDGRVTVLATAVGEESFTDLNANGLYDSTDAFDADEYDLSEAFRDDNENGNYESSLEEFSDFNGNGVRDEGNGIYNGTLCTDAAESVGDCSKDLVPVQRSLTFVMSGSRGYFIFSKSELNLLSSTTDSVTVTIMDLHNNSLPNGTTVDITAGYYDLFEVAGETSYEIGSTTNVSSITFDVSSEVTEGDIVTDHLVITTTTGGPEYENGETGQQTISTATLPVQVYREVEEE